MIIHVISLHYLLRFYQFAKSRNFRSQIWLFVKRKVENTVTKASFITTKLVSLREIILISGFPLKLLCSTLWKPVQTFTQNRNWILERIKQKLKNNGTQCHNHFLCFLIDSPNVAVLLTIHPVNKFVTRVLENLLENYVENYKR